VRRRRYEEGIWKKEEKSQDRSSFSQKKTRTGSWPQREPECIFLSQSKKSQIRKKKNRNGLIIRQLGKGGGWLRGRYKNRVR